MSKTIKYLILLVVAMSLALASCSVDKPENTGVAKTTGHQVKFTLSSGKMMTRAAAAVSGFDREKAISNSNIYAVSFESDGTYHGTHTVSESSGDFGFDVGAAGSYYIYVVANPTIENFLTKQYDDEADFLSDIETADPGADLAASTNFLMLSRRTLADVDAENETDLGTIELVRAAARIDIDATAISGIEIKQVTVKNRYTSTKLSRIGGDTDMSDLTKQDAKVYIRGSESGQIAAISNTTALVNDEQWQGVIYSYENLERSTDATAITVLEITHELNGIESTTTVPFENTPLKRNGLYTVTLNEAAAADVQEIVYTITVVDWNSVGLAFTGTTDTAKPSFSVTSNHTSNATTNPTMVRAIRTDDNAISLKVISGGAMGSEVVFMGGVVRGDNEYTIEEYTAANGATPIGDPTNTYNATTGLLEQTFTIAVPRTLAENMLSSDYLRFRVCNQYDASQYQEFDIKSGYNITFDVATGSVYNHGTALTPAVSNIKVIDDNQVEHSMTNSECTITYSDNTDAGTGSVLVSVNAGDYAGSSMVKTFEIAKAQPTLTLSASAVNVNPNKSTTVTATLGNADAYPGTTLAVTGQDANYATIAATAELTNSVATISITGVADTPEDETITVSAAETDNYKDVSASFTLKVQSKTAATVTTAPAKRTGLTYTGSAQALITAGVASGGTLMYKLNSGTYSTNIPNATNAGTYSVTYYVKADDEHINTSETTISDIVIAKAASSMSNGSGAVGFTSSQGANSTISRTITCNGCSVSVGGASIASGSGFSVSCSGNTITVKRTSTAAFSGTITVTGTGDSNHNDPSNISISVSGPIYDPGVSLANATVGMVIATNGKAYNTVAIANQYGTACAIIAYKGNGEADTRYNTGLAIALNDVSSAKKWKSSDDDACTAQNPDLSSIRSNLSGLSHTATLVSSSHIGHGHDAAKAANNYSVARPSNTSKWFLPTMGQWNLMVKAMCGQSTNLTTTTNDNFKAAAFNTKITDAGGTGVQANAYWSSVEYNTYNAWYMYFGNGRAISSLKSATYYVRPVLAF